MHNNSSFKVDNACYTITDGKNVVNALTWTPVYDEDAAQIKSKDDTKIYDPYDHGKEKQDATSFWGIVGHIIVISVGPTLLTIPASFVDTGYVTGSLGTILTVFLYAFCMRTLTSTEYELCKRSKRPNMTYIEVVKNAFEYGPPQLRWCSSYVQVIVYVVFLCIWIGGLSMTFILAGQNLKNAYEYFFNTTIPDSTFNLYLILPLVALCWIPSLKMLVPLSTFTNIVSAVCIVIMLYHAVIDIPSFNTRPMFTSWLGFPILVGVQLYTINTTCLVLPFKNELRHPKNFRSKLGVITVAFGPVGVIYLVFGLLCYIKYGADSQDSIILNLPANVFNKTLIALYGIGNCFFYALAAQACLDIIWNNMLKAIREKIERPLVYEYICRTSIAISSITFALAIPNLSLFLAFSGTVGTSIDSLIVPALTEMLIYYKKGKYFLYAKDCLIITFASVLIVMGTMDCVKQLIKTYQ